MLITVDFPKKVLEAPSTVGRAAQDAYRKACVALENEILVGEFPQIDEVPVEASLVQATGAPPSPWAR